VNKNQKHFKLEKLILRLYFDPWLAVLTGFRTTDYISGADLDRVALYLFLVRLLEKLGDADARILALISRYINQI